MCLQKVLACTSTLPYQYEVLGDARAERLDVESKAHATC